MENQRKLIDFYYITEKKTETHYHQNLEIIYMLEGSVGIQIDDENYELGKGDYLLINANKSHTITEGNATTEENEILGVRYEIDFHLLAKKLGTMQLFFWCNTVADRNDAYAEVREVLDQIAERYFEKDDEGILYLNSLYYKLLHLLTSNFMVKAYDTRLNMVNSQDRVRIVQIQNYIQANYQMQISLNDLAERLYLSNAYLSKYIKKHLGLTFIDYLNNVRLFHALDELLYSNKKLTHIALDNGFPSSAAFSKTFKTVYHETPVAYRSKVRKEAKYSDSAERKEDDKKIAEYLKNRENFEKPEIKERNQIVADAYAGNAHMHAWEKVVNLGEAEMLLHSDVQQHILQIYNRIPFEYGRIWNIAVLMPFEEQRKTGNLNFNRLDRVMDFLVKNNIKPYIEMGFKPTQIMSTPKDTVETTPVKVKYPENRFDEDMMRIGIHLVNRYGVEQLENWYFEVWNDPDLHMDQKNARYYEIFDIIYDTMKKISPNIKVGGAGFILGIENRFCAKVFRIWRERKVHPDFISLYSYQYMTITEGDTEYRRKSIDGNYMQNQLEIVKEIMKKAEFEIPEIHISEWNCTVSNRNVLNDSCEQGAYVMKNCIEMADQVAVMGYWHLTDLHSEYYDTYAILYGDSGLVSKDGIFKPAFYAFEFMHKMLSMVIGKTENALVTTNGRNKYAIACHNFQKLSYRYAEKAENEIELDQIDQYLIHGGRQQHNVRIEHVNNGTYVVKTSVINQEHGSVQSNWQRMGYITELSDSEIEYMKMSAIPLVEIKTIQVTDHVLDVEMILEEQEIRLVEIGYQY